MESIFDTLKSFIPLSIKRAIRQPPQPYRMLTGQIRLMPDFIIIGAQKGGTTSLYNLLIGHPCIASALVKEVHFFDKNFMKGITWYKAHFPSFLYKYYAKKMHGLNFITGEASPYYIFHPHAPKRISEIVPRVKIIVLLRNPIDRAYSHYHEEVRREREPLSFEDAIKREWERINGEMGKMLEDENYYSFNHQYYSYLSRGIYVDQLKVWMNFFPKEQILILKSEDFYSYPETTLRRVVEFLNLPGWDPKDYRKYNESKYPKMNATTRKYLIDYFLPHNQRLYEYLGMDFEWDR